MVNLEVGARYKEGRFGDRNEEGVAQAVIDFLYDFAFSIGFYNVGMMTTAPKIDTRTKQIASILSDIFSPFFVLND
jgi:hypothetical protein